MNKSVYSVFTSLSGEASLSGVRTLFIRLKGCNLRCSYCDTVYAQEVDTGTESNRDILNILSSTLIDHTEIKNVVITGGEPLLQLSSDELRRLDIVADKSRATIQIETNGSIPLPLRSTVLQRTSYIMDYKLPSSGVNDLMQVTNFSVLSSKDEIKFVIKDQEDFDKMLEIINTHNLSEKVKWLWVSPCYGVVDMEWLWMSVVNSTIPNLRIQMQIHKIFVPNATPTNEV